jgi:hypothetical protein
MFDLVGNRSGLGPLSADVAGAKAPVGASATAR